MTAPATFYLASLLMGQVFAVAAGPVAQPGHPPAAANAAAPGAPTPVCGAIYTINNERFDGPMLTLEGGKLAIDSDPPRTIPFDEVERIDLEAVPTVVWIGQENVDRAGANGNPTPNGIQDMHLQCRGLPAARQLTQVVISGVFRGAAQVWLQEPGNTPFWRLMNQRAQGSNLADLYLEPPASDCFEQDLSVLLTFDDKSSYNLRIKPTTHTDASLKLVKTDQATTVAPTTMTTLWMTHDEKLTGEVIELADEMLTLRLATGASMRIPLSRVRGCWLGGEKPEQRKTFDEKLASGSDTDWAIIMGRDNEAGAVLGSLKGLVEGKFEFVVDELPRKVSKERLLGFVMATHPIELLPDSFFQSFELVSGDKLFGRLSEIKPDVLTLTTLAGSSVQLPRGEVRAIVARNGRATYLSDMEPATIEEEPYFERRLPYRRDQGLLGGPLLLRGKNYRKGIAVHSRTVLTYALAGRFQTLQGQLGFEDSSPPGGSVACRILADDREVYSNLTLKRETPPVALKLELDGAKQLTLEIDYGDFEDVGDRVVWAGARVFRPITPDGTTASSPQTSPSQTTP